MAELPIMPMHWDAYFTDTRHLTCLEHGAYLLLLASMWQSGGTLPNDDKILARLTKLTAGQWHRIKPTIMAFMHPIAGGLITQDKLCITVNTVRRKVQSQKDNANARWLKKKGLPDAMALRRQSNGNAIQISKSITSLVQSSTPAEEKSGLPEKQEAVTAPASIEITSALKNNRLARAS